MRIFLFALIISVYPFTALSAEGVNIEEYARYAAKAANEMYRRSPPNDGVTVSSRAYTIGKAIVYENVLAIRANVTERELSTWKMATRSEILPMSCSILKKDPFFRKGLHFRYIYLDRSGRVLDDILVNSSACNGF